MSAQQADEDASSSDRPAHDIESITSVAIEVLHENGYDRTSMADIARRAGVTKAALYHHAPGGKAELLRRATSRGLDPLWAAVEESRERGGSPLERLEFVLDRQIAVMVARLPEVALFLQARGPGEVEREAVDRRRQLDREVAGLVREAQDAGEVRGDLDASVTARLLLGMTNSATAWWRDDGRCSPEELRRMILAVALDGVRGAC